MGPLRLLIHCILLATTPIQMAFPQVSVGHGENFQRYEKWVSPTTYDEIIQLLEDLESGELERRYSPFELERVNDYLMNLAKEGILPDESEEDLEEDAYELMYGDDGCIELIQFLKKDWEYAIIPAVLNENTRYSFVQCGKISRAWKKTKKFAKKHKKEIIIGAVVVVAVAAVTVAVVAASSAGAASAAGAAGAAASAKARENKSESAEAEDEPSTLASNSESISPIEVQEDVTLLKDALNDHISGFKEFLVEDKTAQDSSDPIVWDDLSFSEKIKEIGASIAHEAFEEVAELVKIVPKFFDEVEELSSKFLPEGTFDLNEEEHIGPSENYENLVTKGHLLIDDVFSTDQAEFFTSEVRANFLNDYALGFLPPPGAVPISVSDTSKFIRAGKAIDRAGFTKAGRNLMKHGYRKGSVFPKPRGNPTQVNAHGQQVLESIVNHPERVIYERPHPDFGKVVEIVVPDKFGARFTIEAEMIGFLEP